MKNIMKRKYEPCELNVVEFKVELWYAASNVLNGYPISDFTQQTSQTINGWMSQGEHSNRNQAYVDEILI